MFKNSSHRYKNTYKNVQTLDKIGVITILRNNCIYSDKMLCEVKELWYPMQRGWATKQNYIMLSA